MIEVFNVEDLTIDDVDDLIEKGVVFNVRSKATVLPESRCKGDRDSFWGIGDIDTESIRHPTTGESDS